ncbi:MAG TPA: murein biosynthesis integral membrane protein MurJ [Pyrinomonadaceae bacterium]|nr:murein biosynthesis integral membrane protein MurJ [Pyrinomonadaceae bacterium]
MNEIRDEEPSTSSAEELTDPDRPLEPATKQQSVARSAGIVSIAVMFSRLLGLLREVVFARYFGAGFLMDAYVVAFRIPNVLRDLFAEGALSVAFVKVFTDYQINKSEKEAWRLASMVFNLLAVILSIICIVGVIFSKQFVALIAGGFSPEKAALATTMTQIMFPFILLVALAAVAMGVLNTKGIFGVPASASTVFNITSILFGLGMAYWLSGGGWTGSNDKDAIPSDGSQWAIIGMSIGTLIGGAAQLAMQVPSLLKVGFRFSPVLSFADEGIRKVAALMAPAILGTSAVQINVMINTSLVSEIGGAQGWLNYAFRLMQFPIGLFGVAVGTAAIPVMSRLASEGKTKELRDTISSSMNLVFLMTLPSACGLIVLGEPIIRLIYERGKFDATATSMTAVALIGYSIGLTGYAAIKILSPAFYALNDAKTPMIIAIASIAVNFIGGYLLREWFSHYGVTPDTPHGYGHVGVALATSLVALVNFFALALLMRRRIKRLNGRAIASSFAKIAAASAVLSVVCYATYRFLFDRYGSTGLSLRAVEAFLPIILGGVAFIIAAKLLRVHELEQLFATLRRKFAR